MTTVRRLARAATIALIACGASAALANVQSVARDVAPAAVSPQRLELQRLYPDAAPLWLDASGQVTGNARDAIALLTDSASDGLDPTAYGVASLASRAAGLSGASPEARLAWDVELSLAMLRYLRDLHFGRVDPRALGFRVSPPRAEVHDIVAMLAAAVATGRVAQLAAELAPPLLQYRELRDSLGRYRRIAQDSPATSLGVPKASVRVGEPYADLGALRERLVVLGDLPAGTPLAAAASYDAALAAGVAQFQARHGLATDGVLGKSTLAELNVPIADRVAQLGFALERMRWLPHPDGRRIVAINIPMFRLWAWNDDARGAKPALGMDVIVGRALKTQTPVFSDEMRYLVFRPYWNVPRSIVRNETLPAIARDPGYLAKNNMEIVQGESDAARVLPTTPDSIAMLRDGVARVRQRPGPTNSLGLVKFIFPNDANIYLHSTPAKSLFERSRRDFSHGCVRVADPVVLAAWLLKDQPQWTRERIVAAMDESYSLHVNLTQPVPVLLYYVTAMVSPEDGSLHFAADIYGHDARLARALAALRDQ
ncbi:MAG: L,D-transpeptidase family protein [Burkholderiales bacterium]